MYFKAKGIATNMCNLQLIGQFVYQLSIKWELRPKCYSCFFEYFY